MKKKSQNYSFCNLGKNYIKNQLDLIYKTSPKIKLHSDFELLHKTRIAARKLNISLTIFRFCLRTKQYKVFKKETSSLFKYLGKARDLDVQIQNLGEVAAKLRSKEKRIGIDRLIWRKIQSREDYQPKLEKSLKRYLKNDFVSKINFLFKDNGYNEVLTSNNFIEVFENKGLKKAWEIWLSKILSFDSSQSDKKIAMELHNLRINIKKIRYVLEIFQPILNDGLDKKISSLKNLQETLGIIHDSDMWIAYLPEFSKEEKEKTIDFFGYIPPAIAIDSGIEFLRSHHLEKRKLFYKNFLKEWNKLKSENFWDNILTLSTKQN